MRALSVLLAAVMLMATGVAAEGPREYAMTGMVMKVDAAQRSFVVSHDSVPGVMAAMTMAFDVRRAEDLAGVAPGASVTFTLVLDRGEAHAERVQVVPYRSVEQDPITARRLALLKRLSTAPKPIARGQGVPDFALIDQVRRPAALSQFKGKVVAVNFIYTSCALPQFCYRTANHFAIVAKRFAERMGRDLVLLTISFDPGRDTPEKLAEYASQWKADPASWRFLTGTAADVQRVCEMFGVDFFPDEGLLNHSVHTAIIDRSGRLVANLEGNRFSAAQLGDLVATTLSR